MSTKNLYQKINQVMLEVESVEKGARIEISSTRSYTAVTHDDVTRLLHMPIAKAGLVILTSVIESKMDVTDKTKEYNGKVTTSKEYMASVTIELTAVNMDKPEEKISVNMPAIAFDPTDKAFGKAISMATKYALLKLFMLDSYDEEEKRPEPGTTYSHKVIAPKTGQAPVQAQPRKETMAQAVRRAVEEEMPTPAIEKKPGPLYRFQNGKFKDMQMKDISLEQLENYSEWMRGQSNLGPRQKDVLHAMEYFINNYEMFKEEILSESQVRSSSA